jgi:hypothetical protein
LREFCKRLETKWRASGKKNKKLRSVIVVLNKRDKATSEKERQCREAFRKIIDAELREARGSMMADIIYLPCVLVTNPEGPKAVTKLITKLAKALAK